MEIITDFFSPSLTLHRIHPDIPSTLAPLTSRRFWNLQVLLGDYLPLHLMHVPEGSVKCILRIFRYLYPIFSQT